MNKKIDKEKISKHTPGIRFKMLIYFGLICSSILIGILLIYIFGMPFFGYHGAIYNQRIEVLNTLNLIADLKKTNLKSWIDERRNDVSIIANSNIIRELIGNIIETVRDKNKIDNDTKWLELQEDQNYQDLVQFIFNLEQSFGSFEGVVIVDADDGDIICSTNFNNVGDNISGDDYFINTYVPDKYQNILITEQTPFHSRKESDHFHFAISKIIYSKENPFEPLAVIIAVLNTKYFIEPLLHQKGGLGRTGEALLVSINAKILSPLKYELQDGSIAEVFKFEITAKPAVFAARGEEGIISTVDYRSVPVIAAYRHILIDNKTGWGRIEK